ncbi:radical SAM family heme chaperone HemW [Flavobacteriales bacterium]|nr:radical SAM family heme chaperone HemW [Flavobacteriales bacterium]
MAGLYVHVPFCAQACSYCDFHFTTRLNDRSRMVDAIISEIKASMPGWSEHTFRTLYFGGGTPSILGAEAIGRIAEAAFQNADWALEEWTVEANPEDLNTAGLKALKDIGVGRLSVGIQSFDPDVLAWMRRIHSAETAESAVRRAAELGFDHISLDLMYGLPVGPETRWEDDLQRALALPADHLSCYILTAEPRTLYGNQLDKGQLTAPPDEQVVREYNTLCKSTSKAGFEHYEVSNFARPGGRSRHNSAYWDGTPYLGVGPGAHSFSDSKRWWNARSNAAFLRASEQGSEGIKKQQASEVLSNTDRFNEALITGLRRTEGVHPAELLKDTGLDLLAQDGLQTLIGRGDCEWHNGRLRIPEPRWPMGDAITLELMH